MFCIWEVNWNVEFYNLKLKTKLLRYYHESWHFNYYFTRIKFPLFLLFALSREDFVILFLPPGCHFMGRPARLPGLCFARPAPPVHTCTRAWTDALASSGCYTCSWDTTSQDFLFPGNISKLHDSEMGAGPQKYFCTVFCKQIKHSF